MKVNWIIDPRLTSEVSPKLLESLKNSENSHIIQRSYDPFETLQDLSNIPEYIEAKDEPAIVYGSHQFLKKLPSFCPGAWGCTGNTNYSVYSSVVPSEWFLNSDFIMLPYKQVKERAFEIYPDGFFLRPNSGFKSFAGQRIKNQEDLEKLSCVYITSDTTCILASLKNIFAEFRFVIGANSVITGSQYTYDQKLHARIDIIPQALELARKVANHDWQVDNVYVCDVAILDSHDGPAKIVEFNSFSCAGLYQCDTDILVERLNRLAIDEYYGND